MSNFISDVTEVGGRVDQVQIFLLVVMAFWFIACNGLLVYFMFRYKRKGPDDKVSTIRGNHTLEIVWTLVPTLLVLAIFWFGVDVWNDIRDIPEDSDAYLVEVTAKKWSWSFKHTDSGRLDAKVLYVPQGQKVKLRMTSTDVIHSFFIPEFRVKEDTVPSMYTYLWFKADKAGDYHIFCTEFCGDEHSQMLGTVKVLTPDQWSRFLADEPINPWERKLTPLERGEELFVANGCKGCHSLDGTNGQGPTLKAKFGTEESLVDGSTVMIDENYIKRSIEYPNEQIVSGFSSGIMPAFKGLISEDDLADIITYIKTIN